MGLGLWLSSSLMNDQALPLCFCLEKGFKDKLLHFVSLLLRAEAHLLLGLNLSLDCLSIPHLLIYLVLPLLGQKAIWFGKLFISRSWLKGFGLFLPLNFGVLLRVRVGKWIGIDDEEAAQGLVRGKRRRIMGRWKRL